MTRWTYTLTTDRPISAGATDARGNLQRVHRLIPGATVRGALAALWWRDHDVADPQHQAAFSGLFDMGLQVGQAVPEDYELISASANVCKYEPEPGCASVVLERGLPDTTSIWSTCPHCGGPLDRAPGWRRRPSSSATRVTSRTRSALAANETADKGNLFTRQALTGEAGRLTLVGQLTLPDGATPDWLKGSVVRIGGGRSLDYGRCTITLTESTGMPLPANETLLVRLASPAVLLDAYGGPDLSEAALVAELRRVSGDHVEVSADPSWLRTEPVSGWHMRSRLPKPLDWTLAPGTVARVTGLTAAGWNKLQAGIGYRTDEGYGQLDIVTRESVGSEPANVGVRLVQRLKSEVRKQQDKRTVRSALVGSLETILDNPATRAGLLKSFNVRNLDGQQQNLARSVLEIPIGHIPGTLEALRSLT